jgi:hypothetical protein
VTEVWIPVLDYEGVYEASNLGRIRRVATGHVLNVEGQNDKYPHVSLSKIGVVSNVRVHRAVLSAFCGPEPFEGAQVAHNNGNTWDCRLVNLRWATPVENQADVDRHGKRCKGEAVFGAVLSEPEVRHIRARIAQGERNRPIAEDYEVSVSTIHLIRHNRIWRHVT